METLVGMGAQCMCSMGSLPVPLNTLQQTVFVQNRPIVTAQDNKPMVNIMPFGMCKSLGNPAVKPPVMPQAPCVPNTAAPWMPGSPTVLVGNVPALNNSCKLICNYGGVISIMNPGITKVMVK